MDESNPDFMVEALSLFIQEARDKMETITALTCQNKQVDRQELDITVHRLKGGAVSVGAKGLADECASLRKALREADPNLNERVASLSRTHFATDACYRELLRLEKERALSLGGAGEPSFGWTKALAGLHSPFSA